MTETRTLLVERGGKDKFRIEIPADWKVTFGKSGGNRGFDGERELRIYENESKQRACFVGVTAFRDLAIPVERLVVSESGESSWSRDESGLTEKRSVKRSKKWEKDA